MTPDVETTSYLNCSESVAYITAREPDYCHDLNAMHEAEKSLDDDLDLDYSESLESVTGTRWGANNAYDIA